MKVILRNAATDLYFIGTNMWTNDPDKALDFGRADRALRVARSAGLKDLELIMSFCGVPQELRLPVEVADRTRCSAA